MASRKQIEMIIEKMEASNPVELFKNLSETQRGIGAVLRLLYESNGTTTAGKISEELNVSTARVAVLLKKMVAKGLLTKEKGITDGRVTLVRLTELGDKTVSKMRDEMCEQVGCIIDTVGEERLLEFIDISNEIISVVKAPNFDF